MPAPLSIIIPTLNATHHLPPLLHDLMSGLTDGILCEVILSDGGSTDAIAPLGEACGATLITGPAGRGGQLARGADQARGDWLLFLHADSRLPETWPEILRQHMATHPRSAAAFRLRFDDTAPMARITAGWANLRSRLFRLPYGDQGLLIPRTLYRDIGGFPDIPLMEDVAIARALGTRLRLLPGSITTRADRYTQRGWLRQGSRNLITLFRYLTGTPPERLARAYSAD